MGYELTTMNYEQNRYGLISFLYIGVTIILVSLQIKKAKRLISPIYCRTKHLRQDVQHQTLRLLISYVEKL
jgi:hypothetical protein